MCEHFLPLPYCVPFHFLLTRKAGDPKLFFPPTQGQAHLIWISDHLALFPSLNFTTIVFLFAVCDQKSET